MHIKPSLIDKITLTFGTRNQNYFTYLWVARIRSWYKFPLAIAVVRIDSSIFQDIMQGNSSNVEYRGLIVQLDSHSRDEFMNGYSAKYVTFEEGWQDSVRTALSSLNIVGEEGADLVDDAFEDYSFDFCVYSQTIHADFDYMGHEIIDPSIQRLWNAFMTTLTTLVNLYNDDEVRGWLEPPDYQVYD